MDLLLSMEIWLVYYYNPNTKNWEIMGAFSSEEGAVSVCEDDTWFIAPLKLDHLLPKDSQEWEGLYYPKILGHEDEYEWNPNYRKRKV